MGGPPHDRCEFIAKVNSLRWGKATKCPRVKNVCSMANLGSTKVSDGMFQLLLPAHLNVLVAKETDRQCGTLRS